MIPKLVAGAEAASRSSSKKSNSDTSAVSAASITTTAAANWRPKYTEIVYGIAVTPASPSGGAPSAAA